MPVSPAKRIAISTVTAVAGITPLFAIRLAERGVRALEVFTGQRVGAGSVAAEAKVAARFLPERDALVFDVGAYKGRWTHALLQYAGPRVRTVYAFEPQRAFAERIRAKDPDKVEVVSAAVSSESGTASVYAPGTGSSATALYMRYTEPKAFTVVGETKTVTIDEFVAERGIATVHFMKMDVEGHELEVLKGASRLIRQGGIPALAFEFGSPSIDAHTFMLDLWRFLSPLGYRFYRILPGARLLSIYRYHLGLERFGRAEYVAVLRDLGCS
jgi:FkbM family methyltransferase